MKSKLSDRKLHELWIAGIGVKMISKEYGIAEGALYSRVSKLRKTQPLKWPKRKTKMKVHYLIYECQDCILSFAVEKAFKDQDDVTCPICWEKPEYVRSGVLEQNYKE